MSKLTHKDLVKLKEELKHQQKLLAYGELIDGFFPVSRMVLANSGRDVSAEVKMTEHKNLAGYTKSDYVRALQSAKVDYICSYDSMVLVHIALMGKCAVSSTHTEGLKHCTATTKGEMEHWLSMTNKTSAENMFSLHFEIQRIEDEIFDEILRILGANPDDTDTWPFFDYGWDWYDSSSELYSCNPDLRLTPEQVEKILALGFLIIYVNHSDGWETHYPGGSRMTVS